MNSVDIDVLRYKYINERKPMHLIADEMGIAVGSVYNYLHRNGIKTRKKTDYPASEKEREAWRKIGKSRKGTKLSDKTKAKLSESHRISGIGHKKVRTDGYIAIYFPDHPKSSKEGYIMEHVLVMEALIGRHLTDEECVHHIDGDRANNKKENLKLTTKSEHMSYHSSERYRKNREKRRNDLSIQ